MKPFSVSNEAKELKNYHLNYNQMFSAISNLKNNELEGVIRLWISEGIPYAFLKLPMLYESIRCWFADQIKVHPKEITIIGSARTGYCMDNKEFGRNFNENSDLDLSVISNDLFEKCSKEFENFKDDFMNNRIQPKDEWQIENWPKMINVEIPRNINKGFIDPNRIDNNYPTVKSIWWANKILIDKINLTTEAPKVEKSSIRVFKNWSSFFKHQIVFLIM